MTWTDPRAVFFSPHPDDELLSMGPAIQNHVQAGREVHVVLVTQGGASGAINQLNGTTNPNPWWGVIHNPIQEGYSPLIAEDFKAARLREFKASCSALGVFQENLHIYDLPDGSVATSDVKAIIESDFNWPGASFKSTYYQVDAHPDHLATGQALHELNQEYPEIWGDTRYYLMKLYWNQFQGVFEHAPNPQRVLNAINAYTGWAPQVGHFAIGAHSTYTYFEFLKNDPSSKWTT